MSLVVAFIIGLTVGFGLGAWAFANIERYWS